MERRRDQRDETQAKKAMSNPEEFDEELGGRWKANRDARDQTSWLRPRSNQQPHPAPPRPAPPCPTPPPRHIGRATTPQSPTQRQTPKTKTKTIAKNDDKTKKKKKNIACAHAPRTPARRPTAGRTRARAARSQPHRTAGRTRCACAAGRRRRRARWRGARLATAMRCEVSGERVE